MSNMKWTKRVTVNVFLTMIILATSVGHSLAQVPNTFQSGTPASAAEVNENFSYLSNLAIPVPVGSIVAWFNYGQSLPPEFQLCDGSSILSGPLAGNTTPDLNMTGLFLRGNTTSGIEQSDSFKSHNHTYAIRTSESFGGASDAAPGTNQPAGTRSGSTAATGDSETRPKNMSVIWVMRIN